jgi:predicted metal-binding transcription factor (methanogenesis marker protein 9)
MTNCEDTIMDKAKRKRLESAGWKVGTANDFLNLSSEESAYIELKLQLAKNLLKRRIEKKLTQTEVARMLKSSQSRVAKMEAGDPTVSVDLLIRSLLTLGARPKGLLRFIAQ